MSLKFTGIPRIGELELIIDDSYVDNAFTISWVGAGLSYERTSGMAMDSDEVLDKLVIAYFDEQNSDGFHYKWVKVFGNSDSIYALADRITFQIAYQQSKPPKPYSL